jgi:ABC-type phosphate transport system substrate-binding protein
LSGEVQGTLERPEIGADLFEAALQLRNIAMKNSMKPILTVVALCAGLTAPAFAKDQAAIRDAQAVHPVVHVYAIDYYEAHHGASRVNPDRQGSGYRD